MPDLSPAEINDVARLVMAAKSCGPQLLDDGNDFIVGLDPKVLDEARRIIRAPRNYASQGAHVMTTEVPRALSRPGALPLYALIGTDGTMIGVQTFEDGRLPVWSDGRHYLPVFGDEPPADLDRQYFMDSYEIEGDRVIRTRTVHDRGQD